MTFATLTSKKIKKVEDFMKTLHIHRKRGQAIVINNKIIIRVRKLGRGRVALEIQAPDTYAIWREEIDHPPKVPESPIV